MVYPTKFRCFLFGAVLLLITRADVLKGKLVMTNHRNDQMMRHGSSFGINHNVMSVKCLRLGPLAMKRFQLVCLNQGQGNSKQMF